MDYTARLFDFMEITGVGVFLEPVFVLLAGIAITAAGLLLFLTRARSGSDPYCGICGYNLTALESARCPECGVLAEKHKVIGKPVKAPKPILGAVLVLGGVTVFSTALPRIDLYKLKPTGALISDLSENNRAARAWGVLQGRLENMSKRKREQLIEQSLDLAGVQASNPIASDLLIFLAKECMDGALNEAQRVEFCRKLFGLSIEDVHAPSDRLLRIRVRMLNPLVEPVGEPLRGFVAHVDRLTLEVPGVDTLYVLDSQAWQLGRAQIDQRGLVVPVPDATQAVDVSTELRIVLLREDNTSEELFRGSIRMAFDRATNGARWTNKIGGGSEKDRKRGHH